MTKKLKTVCYYISGHGYGHAARACQVMAALPAETKIIVRTAVDPGFITRESGRKVQVLPGGFDTGVIQTNNRTLDWKKTLREAAIVNRQNAESLMDETELLRSKRVDLVVCDVPPFPLEAARMAGVPAAVVGNFTWVEIFEKEAKNFPQAEKLAAMWREQYGLATLAIRTPPAFAMKYFRHIETVQPISRRGRNVKAALRKHLGVSADTKLALMYFGTFGDGELKIPEIPKTVFLTFMHMPGAVRKLDAAQWKFPDVVASVDCVMAKPGYGTIGECMANGTPVVYHPRVEFAEYPVLRDGIKEWGGGVQLPLKCLMSGNWSGAIAKATALKPKKVPCNGAAQTAKLLMGLLD